MKSGLVSSNAWMRNKDESLLSFLKSSFFSQVREDNGDYIQFHIHFILDNSTEFDDINTFFDDINSNKLQFDSFEIKRMLFL